MFVRSAKLGVAFYTVLHSMQASDIILQSACKEFTSGCKCIHSYNDGTCKSFVCQSFKCQLSGDQ